MVYDLRSKTKRADPAQKKSPVGKPGEGLTAGIGIAVYLRLYQIGSSPQEYLSNPPANFRGVFVIHITGLEK